MKVLGIVVGTFLLLIFSFILYGALSGAYSKHHVLYEAISTSPVTVTITTPEGTHTYKIPHGNKWQYDGAGGAVALTVRGPDVGCALSIDYRVVAQQSGHFVVTCEGRAR